MKKQLLLHKEFILGLILTLSLLWPLLMPGYFTHHDDVQIIRLFEMDKCIKDGQIPCRWVPDLGGLYGYPIFNYYAPLPYYFGEVIYLIFHNLIFSAKIMFASSFIASYIFMYFLASKFWGKKGGSIAAIFYSFAPYHALDFYVRGAMGEMWALVLFPAVFWAAKRIEEKSNILNLLIFGISISALILSHNLSAMIFMPLTAIWMILLFLKRKDKKMLWFSLGGVFLGILLSAFYLLPALFEKNLVHLETTVEGYFSYTEHFKGFRKLFLDRSWGYGASVREVPGGERDGLSYQIGWVHLVGWLLAVIASIILWKKNRWISKVIILGSLISMTAIFMINPRSEIIWKSLDSLKYLQFPWRFLLLVIFFISFISGSIFMLNFKYKNLLWVLLILAVVSLNVSYFKPEKFIQTSDAKLLSGKDWDKQIKRSIFDYLPIYAKEPPAELAIERYEILTGESKILNFKEGSNWFNFQTDTSLHTIIRLSQYYFPNWKISVDGVRANVEYKNNSLGLMTIILGKGHHVIEGKLYDTPIRLIANFLTLIGFGISIILFLLSFTRVRVWLSYYRKRIN